MEFGSVLNPEPNIDDPDGFFQALVDSQRFMTDEEANQMNARLILILSNEIGDKDRLRGGH